MAELVRVKLPAEAGSLPKFRDSVLTSAEEQGLASEKLADLDLALEEALVNVFRYAYPDQTGDVEVYCDLDGEELVVNIADHGSPFDPLSRDDPDVTLGIEDREIGGLGIMLVKSLADEVRYRRDGNRNVLSLVFGVGPKKE